MTKNGEAQTETFEQRVQREGGGNIADYCRQIGLPEEQILMVRDLLQGRVSLSASNAVIKSIAAQVGEQDETLFPARMYPERLFQHVCDTPGYQALAAKHDLHWRKHNKSLKSYCRAKGLSNSDITLLHGLLYGRCPVSSYLETSKRIAHTLDIDFAELFPPSVYMSQDLESLRVPISWGSQYIADNTEAQQTIENVCSDESIDVESQSQALSDLFRQLRPRQKAVLRAYFGLDGEERRSLEKIGHSLHVKKQRVNQIKKAALGRLRGLIEQNPDKYNALLGSEKLNDRVVI